jgi:hypothetical protein
MTSDGLHHQVLAKHFQFGVLNRPNSVKQLLESQEMMSHIKSEYEPHDGPRAFCI